MPLTPDGRIQSRNLDTGSVNSRVIDDLRSSNWDGDKEDPETTPGSVGWAIFKSGLLIANNAIFRGAIEAAEILTGSLHVGGTGRVTAGTDPENPAASFDASGLKIDGVLQEANWIDEQFEFDSSPTLSTSFADLASVTVSPPSWVETLSVMAYGAVHANQSALAVNQLSAFVRIDGTDGPTVHTVNEGYSVGANTLNQQAVPVVFSRTITSPSDSLSVSVRAKVFNNSPSVGGNAGVTVLAVGRLSS